MIDKKLAEFRYKLLHNLLCCNEKLYKWKIRNSITCSDCSEIGSVKHMLLTCPKVQEVWKIVGATLQLKIQWKHLVIGLEDSAF